MDLGTFRSSEVDEEALRARASRVAPVGAGAGGAIGAAIGSTLAGSTTEAALLAGVGAALAVLLVWATLALLG